MTARLRRAGPADALALMRLYHWGDIRRLEAELAREDQLWCLAEKDGAPVAFASAAVDLVNRMAKVQNMAALSEGAARRARLGEVLGFLMGMIGSSKNVDVCYSTTRTLTLEEQSVTLDHGFHILGVFPTAISADKEKINGLTAWYAEGVLREKRYAAFHLHPAAKPFYELTRKQCGLLPLPSAVIPQAPEINEPGPALELVMAPLFTAERFKRLRQRRSLSVNFYPFQFPNALLLSPDENVQVFATISRSRCFATIIGEHLTASVDPAALYSEVTRLLYSAGIRYIEIINDAADVAGIEAIRRAGYSPCGYFPCLKNTSELRRDYVVFAKSFDFFAYRPLPIHPLYAEFTKEFCKARDTLLDKEEATSP